MNRETKQIEKNALKIAQEYGLLERQKCPRCGEPLEYPMVLNSLSRRDNQTYICAECGTLEALEDFGLYPVYKGTPYWNFELTPSKE